MAYLRGKYGIEYTSVSYEEDGIVRDDAEAVKWYRKAAEQGHIEAQNRLGIMYRDGRGVTQDYTEAVKCFLKAAEQGNAEAQFNLAEAYYHGNGIDKDGDKAHAWFCKASRQGVAKADGFIKLLESNPTSGLLRRSKRLKLP